MGSAGSEQRRWCLVTPRHHLGCEREFLERPDVDLVTRQQLVEWMVDEAAEVEAWL